MHANDGHVLEHERMFEAQIARVLIASPSDVEADRDVVEQTIREWNALNGEAYRVVLLPVRWESETWPTLDGRPQGVVNSQVVDDCDLIVGCFWTRLGSPTAVAESGTVEEIERVHARDQPVLLYFAQRPTDPTLLDPEQLASLKEFKAWCFQEGLVSGYDTLDNLRHRLMSDLTRQVRAGWTGFSRPEEGTGEQPAASTVTPMAEYRSAFSGIILQLQTVWESERGADVPDTESWRDLASRAGDVLLRFMTQLAEDLKDSNAPIVRDVRTLIMRTRGLSRQRFYMDGGRSLGMFIENMNKLIEDMQRIEDADWGNYEPQLISGQDEDTDPAT